MGMTDDVLERIAVWEAAGLIDGPTADRLRVAESESRRSVAPSNTSAATSSSPAVAPRGGPINPTAVVVEVFGYLGAAFVIGAWFLFVDRLAGDSANADLVRMLGAAIAAAGLACIGVLWRAAVDARGRAASIAFLVSTASVAGAAYFGFMLLGFIPEPSWAEAGVLISAVGLLAAAIYRLLRPALGTQVGLLIGVTALASAVSTRARDLFFAGPVDTYANPDLFQVGLTLGFWWVVALGIGLLGLAEARSAVAGAGVRSAVSRLWAGLTAVFGTVLAMTMSTISGERIVPATVGDVILLVLAAVFVERAIRRHAAAFIVPAAVGTFLALSDINNTLASSLGNESGVQPVFLLVEGLLLLAVAGAAEWFRRRVVAGPITPMAA